jgi:hypothetical protein
MASKLDEALDALRAALELMQATPERELPCIVIDFTTERATHTHQFAGGHGERIYCEALPLSYVELEKSRGDSARVATVDAALAFTLARLPVEIAAWKLEQFKQMPERRRFILGLLGQLPPN